MASSSPSMVLKLLVDKNAKKVLFAEATKEFVDFLFQIFSLPLGTLIEFLGSKNMVGCLGKLKESIEIIDNTYIQPGVDKDHIFNPKTGVKENMLLLSNDTEDVQQETLHKKKKVEGSGYVKEVVTYMVMDDLVVKPMSTISSITLVNSFGVKDLTQLEEKTLSFGKNEALKLLKASLMTDQVLTTLLRHAYDA